MIKKRERERERERECEETDRHQRAAAKTRKTKITKAREEISKIERRKKTLFSPRLLLKTKGGTQKEREKREFYSRRMRELGRLTLGHLLLLRVCVSIVLLFFLARARGVRFFFFLLPFFFREREKKIFKTLNVKIPSPSLLSDISEISATTRARAHTHTSTAHSRLKHTRKRERERERKKL